MSVSQTNLAEQALDNLVNQFARPLDFLRELVQNSIDAGSPRIEVIIDYERPKSEAAQGVTTISVNDWGEGMDETIIDKQLTRLFSSAKEGDLTKIGKFGIGFTSIFAIHPEIVQLKTGRHGENWELLFHADRSYNKQPIDEPVDGTKIKLFKRMDPDAVEKFVEEARFILTYWCEHSNVPVTFWDRTQSELVVEVDDDDPFAAFEDASVDVALNRGPEAVNRPLDANKAALHVQIAEDDVEVVIGIGEDPLYGYYNGGLTLLRTRNTDALGKFHRALRRLTFKVKNDALEHTLTRDNVLQDTHWETAMAVVLKARTLLIEQLIDRLTLAIEQGDDPSKWQEYVAILCEEPDALTLVKAKADQSMYRSALDESLTFAEVTRQQSKNGRALLWDGDDPLARGIQAGPGHHVLLDTPAQRTLLQATHDGGILAFTGEQDVVLTRADVIYVLPEIVEPGELDAQEKRLIDQTTDLMQRACGARLRSVRIGAFGGAEAGAREALCLNSANADGVFERKGPNFIVALLPAILRFRHLLVNRHHPLFRAQLLASTENPWLAAAGLASALLHIEGIEPDRIHRLLLNLAHNRLESL